MQLFYCPGILRNEFFLNNEESRHCSRVLRKNPGETIHIIDGQGTFYVAILTEVATNNCTFEIINKTHHQQSAYYIHIAIAPTKNTDRTEWFVEKAIEIGVNEISFLQTEHSERIRINLERVEKKAISAIKQSIRPYLPKINEIQKLSSFLKRDFEGQKFVAHLEEDSSAFLVQKAIEQHKYLVLIGPEGGFSQQEIDQLFDNGFAPVKLGRHRLRTETAGIVACSILNLINQP
jgi:16S rRNA (uracil1498-N3)-methyltransferase